MGIEIRSWWESITHPVYRFRFDGCTVITRDNFHGLAISVEYPHDRFVIDDKSPIRALLLNPDKQRASCYCKGMNGFVYPPFDGNDGKFTAGINNWADFARVLIILEKLAKVNK